VSGRLGRTFAVQPVTASDTAGDTICIIGTTLADYLPLIVIAVVGLALAGRRVADNPHAARLARIGCVVLLLAQVAAAVARPRDRTEPPAAA
jgi:hypothetical protein